MTLLPLVEVKAGPEGKGPLKRKKGGEPESLQIAGMSKRGPSALAGSDNAVSHNDLESNRTWQYL